MTTERPARPGEVCTCGRPARVVFINQWGPTGWCGISDGGAKGPCVFCNGPAHDSERCARYQLVLDRERSDPEWPRTGP